MRVVFIGTGEIGCPAIAEIQRRADCQLVGVVTQPDRPAGRKMQLREPPVKAMLAQSGLPVLQPGRLRDPDALARLKDLAPDLIVVMAYGQLLTRPILDLPRLGCLNLHASLLPRHRGASPIQAAILAGDRESGITVMRMDEGLDTGDIVLMRQLPLRRRETAGTLHDRLAVLAGQALGDALDLLASNRITCQSQDDSLATYAPKISKTDAAIDWRQAAATVDRRIRAMNPWPGAECHAPMSDGRLMRLKVYSSILFRQAGGKPGAVLRADRRGILVAAEFGAILLREIQPDGRRRMSAGEWVAGNAIDQTARFR